MNDPEITKKALLVALGAAAQSFFEGLPSQGLTPVPIYGPLAAGLITLVRTYRELTAAAAPLPAQARDALQKQKKAWEAFLRAEGEKRPREALASAITTALAVLDQHALDAEELTQQGLKVDRATRETMKAAKDDLQGLSSAEEAWVRRLVAQYYTFLLQEPQVWTLAATQVMLDQLKEILSKIDGLQTRETYQAWSALDSVLPRTEPGRPGTPFFFHELKAGYRLVPYVGTVFEKLRDDLTAWARGLAARPGKAGLYWLYGPGGAGKTRLVVEVVAALKAWEEEEWLAFALPQGMSRERIGRWAKHWAQPKYPTLLLVDYLESRSREAIEALLNEVVQQDYQREAPLALVFLSRPDPSQSGQYQALREWRTRGLNPLAGDLVERLPMAPIPELALDDRRELFQKAVAAFRGRLAVREDIQPIDYDDQDLPQRPLSLILLAFLAAQGHRVARSRDEHNIYKETWDWERRKWGDILVRYSGIPDEWVREMQDRIELALAAATLGRRFTSPDQVAAWWREHFPPRAISVRGETWAPEWLAQRLPELFPAADRDGWHLPPIEPDPLADWVLARRAGGQPSLIARATLHACPTKEELLNAWAGMEKTLVETAAKQTGNILTTLERVYEAGWRVSEGDDKDRPAYREEARGGVGQVNAWLEETLPQLPQGAALLFLEALDNELPSFDRTVLLLPVLETYYRMKLKVLDEEDPEAVAALGNLANVLSALGHRSQATEITIEVNRRYRELAEGDPETYRPLLATSLNNLGNRLSDLGRWEEALQAAKEAVRIRRQLAQEHPKAFLPDLAMSLNNLGTILSELGRRGEALQAAQEATALYRQLAQENPQAFLPYLAASLTNLGEVLSELGRRQEALQAAQEAAELYRQLAQENRKTFLPYLATSLNNLGLSLSDLGRRGEALQAAQEATDLCRQLAQEHPQAFLPDLASSLNNLGSRLSDLGRRGEALQAAQEATALYRRLAQENPKAFLPDLAMSLNNLGAMLSELGRWEEALQAAEEATDLHRQLAQENPQAFLPDLAMSLNNLGLRLSDLGRRQEALQAAEEAVRIRRQLARENPQAFLPDLASSLNNLGNRLSELGRREEALQAAQEATALYRQLAQENPKAFLPYLATSLNNLGLRLSDLGRRQEALQAAQEAAELYRQLAQENPKAFLPDLAMSLNNLGNRLSELGRRQEALQAAQEATALYRQLAQENPQAFLPDLAMSLNNLGNILSELGRWEEALQAAQEAVRIRRQLAQENPKAFLPYLATSLNNLGKMLSDLGRREEALQAAQEAAELYRQLAQENRKAFLPDLAMSLNNLGLSLSDLGRREEALQAAEEAVRIRRQLAREHPQAFLPDLAMSLNNLGIMLAELGRREEALQAAEEAVLIRRQLAQENPMAFLPDLARSLGVYGSALIKAERPQEAAAAFQEGLKRLLPLARQLPQAFAPLLGEFLRLYLTASQAAGQTPDEELFLAAGVVLAAAQAAGE